MLTRLCLAISLCLVTGLANAGGLVPGFRGMQWGDPVSKLGTTTQALAKTHPEQDDCYKRTSDKLVINDIPLSEISYCFRGGKLSLVSVTFDKKVSSRIKKAVIEGYGRPDTDIGVTFVTWGNDKEQGGGTLSLAANGLMFASNDAAHAREVDKLVNARKDF